MDNDIREAIHESTRETVQYMLDNDMFDNESSFTIDEMNELGVNIPEGYLEHHKKIVTLLEAPKNIKIETPKTYMSMQQEYKVSASSSQCF